jgi:hypothetical protein
MLFGGAIRHRGTAGRDLKWTARRARNTLGGMSDPIEQVRDYIESPDFSAAVRGVIETAVNEAVGGKGLSEDDVKRIAGAAGGGDADAVKAQVANSIGNFLTPESLSPIIEPVVQMAIMRALKKERSKIIEAVKKELGQ